MACVWGKLAAGEIPSQKLILVTILSKDLPMAPLGSRYMSGNQGSSSRRTVTYFSAFFLYCMSQILNIEMKAFLTCLKGSYMSTIYFTNSQLVIVISQPCPFTLSLLVIILMSQNVQEAHKSELPRLPAVYCVHFACCQLHGQTSGCKLPRCQLLTV